MCTPPVPFIRTPSVQNQKTLTNLALSGFPVTTSVFLLRWLIGGCQTILWYITATSRINPERKDILRPTMTAHILNILKLASF